LVARVPLTAKKAEIAAADSGFGIRGLDWCLVQTDNYIALDRVRMVYRSRRVFDSLSCSFPRSRISVILGGSGSGKSTILRLIGGLIRPQAGTVVVDGQDVTHLPRQGLQLVRRKMGMMFQGGALLDSYTVFENVALPLRENGRNHGEGEIAAAVREILKAVGVSDADGLYPRELSGGMLRRVALARAMIRKPELLLCDEPFSGLDPVSIRHIVTLLMKLNQQFAMTMIVVSHDIHSTMRMADRVLMVLKGRVLEGAPAELPRTDDAEAAEFFRDRSEPLQKETTC
jgi:phospholipid/cholesterol/gamma-HCH transport system ATP-binding protein